MTITDILSRIRKITHKEHITTAVENFVYQARSLATQALANPVHPDTITIETARTIVHALIILAATTPEQSQLDSTITTAIKEIKAHATKGKPPTIIMGDTTKGGYHD